MRSGNASVRLALTCPAAEAGGCKGTVALTSKKAIKIGGQRVRVVLASKSYSLKAGEKKTVTVKLGKIKALRKLAKSGKLARLGPDDHARRGGQRRDGLALADPERPEEEVGGRLSRAARCAARPGSPRLARRGAP